MVKLYTVTVESELVFASESDDPEVVEAEFRRALRREPEMRDEVIAQADVSA